MTRTSTAIGTSSPPAADTHRSAGAHVTRRSGALLTSCVAAWQRGCAPRHVCSRPFVSLLVCSAGHLPNCASARAGATS